MNHEKGMDMLLGIMNKQRKKGQLNKEQSNYVLGENKEAKARHKKGSAINKALNKQK